MPRYKSSELRPTNVKEAVIKCLMSKQDEHCEFSRDTDPWDPQLVVVKGHSVEKRAMKKALGKQAG